MPGPHKAIIASKQAETIETQIQGVYEASPIVKTGTARGKPVSYYYKPTPEQEQQIIKLAEQLPETKQAQYITVTKPPEQPQEPKGIAETLLTITPQDIASAIFRPLAVGLGFEPERVEKAVTKSEEIYTAYLQPKLVTGAPMPFFGEPIKTVAGVVAPVESLVYSGERLVSAFVTHHKPITPSPPPTVVGGTISAVLGSPEELQKVEEYGPSYIGGTIIGDILLGYAVGKGVEKAWSGVKAVTPQAIKQPITHAVKFGRVAKVAHKVKLATPSFRGSRLDVLLAKKSHWYYKATRGIARGEVAIPPVMERISLGHLKASKMAWEMTIAPRTGGVWIGKTVVATTKSKAMLHLISKGGQVSIGYLRELSYDAEPYWKRGLLPYVTQTQVTRLGIIPHVPKIVSTTGKKGVSMAGAGLISILPRLGDPQISQTEARKQAILIPQISKREPKRKAVIVPKIWQPTFTYEREKLKHLIFLEPKVKEHEKLVPALRISLIEKTTTKVKTTPIVKTPPLTPTILTPPLTPPTLTPPRHVPPFYPRIPRGGFDHSRGGGLLFGKWFEREHKVASPSEVAGTFFGKPRRRKRKGKRKLVKGGGLLRF